jgi:hypothetical protein
MVAKTGEMVVIFGKTDFDREVIQYTNAKDFVAYICKRDHPDGNTPTNEVYMNYIANSIRGAFKDSAAEANINIPTHSEEAFVKALFRLGIVNTTVMN